MIFGEKNVIAIECEIEDIISDQVFGRFQLWLTGYSVGNWDDKNVFLQGCYNWAKDFWENPQNRFEPTLFEKDGHEIFELLYDSVMASPNYKGPFLIDPPYENIYSRFHLSHIGMSSFNRYDLLLVEDKDGRQRVLWRFADDGIIHESYFPPSTIQQLVVEYCAWFEQQVKKGSNDAVGPEEIMGLDRNKKDAPTDGV
jgi:hypothetical protein